MDDILTLSVNYQGKESLFRVTLTLLTTCWSNVFSHSFCCNCRLCFMHKTATTVTVMMVSTASPHPTPMYNTGMMWWTYLRWPGIMVPFRFVAFHQWLDASHQSIYICIMFGFHKIHDCMFKPMQRCNKTLCLYLCYYLFLSSLIYAIYRETICILSQ